MPRAWTTSPLRARMWHMPLLARYGVRDAILWSGVPRISGTGMASLSTWPCAAGIAAERPPSLHLSPSVYRARLHGKVRICQRKVIPITPCKPKGDPEDMCRSPPTVQLFGPIFGWGAQSMLRAYPLLTGRQPLLTAFPLRETRGDKGSLSPLSAAKEGERRLRAAWRRRRRGGGGARHPRRRRV